MLQNSVCSILFVYTLKCQCILTFIFYINRDIILGVREIMYKDGLGYDKNQLWKKRKRREDEGLI